MSLQVRYLTNGEREVFTVLNSGVRPISFEIFDKREDIDPRISHLVPTGDPVFCGPDLAHMFGVQGLFYPDFPRICTLKGYEDKRCIAELCKHYETCEVCMDVRKGG